MTNNFLDNSLNSPHEKVFVILCNCQANFVSFFFQKIIYFFFEKIHFSIDNLSELMYNVAVFGRKEDDNEKENKQINTQYKL